MHKSAKGMENTDHQAGLWAMPPGVPFTKTLARHLSYFVCPDDWPETIIMWPYQLAIQDFSYHVCRHQKRPTPLPRLYNLKKSAPLLQEQGLPPPVSERVLAPLERLGLLLQLIDEKKRLTDNQEAYTFPTMLALAKDLGDILDAATLEGVSFDRLHDLVPETFSRHWQKTLQFMDIVSHVWPKLMKEMNALTPYEHEVAQSQALVDYFEQKQPTCPVMIVGSTGSVPHVRRLMKAVLSLPRGYVILPGFDPQTHHAMLHATHPQKNLQDLLAFLHVDASQVRLFPTDTTPHHTQRQHLIRTAFQHEHQEPAPEADPDVSSAVKGMSLTTLSHEQEEALAIALIIRQALEDPHTSVVACVPSAPMRHLLTAQLTRWHIEAKYTTGMPLSVAPWPQLAFLVIEAALSPHDMTANLAVLKHPLWLAHRPQHLKDHLVCHFECDILRQPTPLLTQDDIDARIQQSPFSKRFAWLMSCLREGLESLVRHKHTQQSAAHWGEQLYATLQHMVGDAASLSPDDNVFLSHLEEISQQATSFSSLTLEDYRDLLAHVLATATTTGKKGHTRVQVLSTREARLIHGDVMILACLNEGEWPTHVSDGPWLNRSMRHHLGFFDDERKQSLQAHDFMSTAAAPQVFLTRSQHGPEGPTSPSRFLLALEHTLAQHHSALPKAPHLLAWVTAMDASDAPPIRTKPPRPNPPSQALPRMLSVTAIELLSRDPYAFYARYILNLKPLPPVGGALDAALFGTRVHRMLEILASEKNQKHSRDTLMLKLFELAHDQLHPFWMSPVVSLFWWQRLKHIIPSIATFLASQPLTSHTYPEVSGRMTVHVGQPITIYARADRLDLTPEGGRIIDYKTGAVPSDREIDEGLSPQLPLEGAMLMKGGFFSHVTHLHELSFWHLGTHSLCKSLAPAPSYAQKALDQLDALLRPFYERKAPFKVQTLSSKAPTYPVYDNLARTQAWQRS